MTSPSDLDHRASGVHQLRASLDRVRTSLVVDAMAVQRDPIRHPDSEGRGSESASGAR